ncbi:MAG: tetratricopeptide repeat protein [Bacteroidota bacterium]
MSLFNKFFGKGNNKGPVHTDFQEGDVFFTEKEGKFRTYKLLKIEEETHTFHVKAYEEINEVPEPDLIDSLQINIHHFPVDPNGFEHPVFILNQEVTEDDLLGYFEYIKQTQNIDEIVKYAKGFYLQANALSKNQDHTTAIHKYSQAIDLLPNFFEAIDNRAFSYMDLGKWTEAIEGFKQSLAANPNALLPIFSIGECYFKLKDYAQAKGYFEQAVQIAPEHPKPKEFLALTNKHLNG